MKMKNLLKLSLVLVAVFFMGIMDADAQMPTAKKIAPKYKNKVELNTTVEKAWKLISQPGKYAEWVSGVEKFECHGKTQGAKISLELKGGEKRKQQVSVLNSKQRLITFFVTESTYLGEPWVYRFQIKKKKGMAVLYYEVYFSSSEAKVKKRLIPKFKLEWNGISEGIKSQF